jgi:iron(III) transport system substrate-binding protein
LETNQLEMAAASHEGLFGPYASEYRDNIREIGQFDDWTAIRYNAFMPQWNTDKVKPGQEPTSFEDLADPKWRGRLSMEIGDSAWLQALYYYFHGQGMSDEDFRAMFTAHRLERAGIGRTARRRRLAVPPGDP